MRIARLDTPHVMSRGVVCAGGGLTAGLKLGMPTAAVAPQPAASSSLPSYPGLVSGQAGRLQLGSGQAVGLQLGSGQAVGLQLGPGHAVGLQLGPGQAAGLQLGSGQAAGGLQLGSASQASQQKGLQLGGLSGGLQLGTTQAPGGGLQLGGGVPQSKGLQLGGVGAATSGQSKGLQLGGMAATRGPSLGGTSVAAGLQTTSVGGGAAGLQLGGVATTSLGGLGVNPGLPGPGLGGGGFTATSVPPSSSSSFRGLGGVDPTAGRPGGSR